jgi:hypothetical protein
MAAPPTSGFLACATPAARISDAPTNSALVVLFMGFSSDNDAVTGINVYEAETLQASTFTRRNPAGSKIVATQAE